MSGPADASSPSAAARLDYRKASKGSGCRRNSAAALGSAGALDGPWSDGCGGYGAGRVDYCCGRSRAAA